MGYTIYGIIIRKHITIVKHPFVYRPALYVSMNKSNARTKSLLRSSVLAVVIIISILILSYMYFLSTISTISTPTVTDKATLKDSTSVEQVLPIERARPVNLRSKGPANYFVEMIISSGEGASLGTMVFEIRCDWAPLGAAQFKRLVEADFFTEARFFRVIKKFMAQFGKYPF